MIALCPILSGVRASIWRLKLNKTLKARSEDIRAWNESLPKHVDLKLIRTDDERTTLFTAFLDQISALAPGIRVSEEKGDQDTIPAFQIEDSWTFHLVPEGTELDPFLELLKNAAIGDVGIPSHLLERLKPVDTPTLVDIFVTTQCPNCPALMAQVCRIPFANRLVRVRAFDGMLFTEKAAEHSIRAVPTVLLADGHRFTGQVGEDEVIDGIINRDPARMGAETFARMINAGDAGGLAEMMLKRGQVFPGFVELLSSELFSLRLGAMVAMEEMGEANPALALEALEILWGRMDKAGPSAKGDMVYLIGKLGNETWRPSLERLLRDVSSPELGEAIKDALASLGGKDQTL
jgi:hypothetical protein